MTFTTSNSYHGNIRWESQHKSMPPSVTPSKHFLILSRPIAFDSLPPPVIILFQDSISFAFRRHQASHLDRVPNVSENKYPRNDVRAKNEVVLVRAKAAPRDYEKHSVPKSGAQIKRAGRECQQILERKSPGDR